jgi:sugar phosphate isomerase/epimerase
VHFKDLGPDRRFTELGTGIVDFPACWATLREADFSGWIVVDLDYTSLDPVSSCRMNMAYLRALGVRG